LNLNLTGVPTDPKVVLVDSHFRAGFSLLAKKGPGKGLGDLPREAPLKAETDLMEEPQQT
jgi:hypothetical protein